MNEERSKPAPQPQEGLTREWLAQYIKQDPDAITGILTRHTQALEAVKVDREALEMTIDTLRAELAADKFDLEQLRIIIATLQGDLAEAKKGRYAIDWSKAPTEAVSARLWWTVKGDNGSVIEVPDTVEHQNPQTPMPSLEQMMDAWRTWYEGAEIYGPSTVEVWTGLAMALIESKGDMGLIYRRDCLGGVE